MWSPFRYYQRESSPSRACDFVRESALCSRTPACVTLRSSEPDLAPNRVVSDGSGVPSGQNADRPRHATGDGSEADRPDKPPRRRSDRGRDNESDDNRNELLEIHGWYPIGKGGRCQGEGKARCAVAPLRPVSRDPTSNLRAPPLRRCLRRRRSDRCPGGNRGHRSRCRSREPIPDDPPPHERSRGSSREDRFRSYPQSTPGGRDRPRGPDRRSMRQVPGQRVRAPDDPGRYRTR